MAGATLQGIPGNGTIGALVCFHAPLPATVGAGGMGLQGSIISGDHRSLRSGKPIRT